MSDEQNKFQEAIDAATAQRTEADKASSAASMDQAMADFERQAADPNGLYAGRPDLVAETRTKLQAIRVRAGLSAAPQPKTPQEIALAAHEQSFSLPETLNENLTVMINTQLKQFEADPGAREAAEKSLKKELGPAGYSALLVDAELYLGRDKMTPEVKASKAALTTAAAQHRYNTAKRTSRPA